MGPSHRGICCANQYLEEENKEESVIASSETGIDEDRIIEVDKIFKVLKKEHLRNESPSSERTIILFQKIKAFPWLLELTREQEQLMKILDQEEAVESRKVLDNILERHGLNDIKIKRILYPEDLLYQPRPYYRKFAYPKTAKNEIERLISMIEKLITLLVNIKKRKINSSLESILSSNIRFQFALQIGIKAFGVIVKDKLGKKAKQALLSKHGNELTARHTVLLETFRNELAHRAFSVDPHQLAWFAVHWSTLPYAALKSRNTFTESKMTQPIHYDSYQAPVAEDEAIEKVLLVRDLAKQYGFVEDVRFFSSFMGCKFGIQAAYNLIVQPMHKDVPHSDYEHSWQLNEFKWQLYFITGWEVQVHTEKTLRSKIDKSMDQTHVEGILRSAPYLISLRHQKFINEMLDDKNCHSIIIENNPKPLKMTDIAAKNIQPSKIKTVLMLYDLDDYENEKRYRKSLFKHESITSLIRERAENYVNNLLQLLEKLQKAPKEIFLNYFQDFITSKNQLNEFYKDNITEIQTSDSQISQRQFSQRMFEDHEKLPSHIQGSNLAQKAKNCWDEQKNIMQKLHEKYGDKLANLCNFVGFALDEIRNPNILAFLLEIKTLEEKEQLINCVLLDFSERFIDPFETDEDVYFIEPTSINLMKSQTIGDVRMHSQTISGIHMIRFDRPVMLENLLKPVTHQYLKLSFYNEMVEIILEKNTIPLPILDRSFEGQIRRNISYVQYQYKPLPENKKMTTENMFAANFDWKYRGKIQRLNGQVVAFQFPPVKDFDTLLRHEGINPNQYPNYSSDKRLFNQFKIAETYLNNIIYYEKQISSLKKHQKKLLSVSSHVTEEVEGYWLNRIHAKEIGAKTVLLRTLQKQHIKALIFSDFIRQHRQFSSPDFTERLIQEITDRVYDSTYNDSEKTNFSNFLSDCLTQSENATPDSFFSNNIPRRKNSLTWSLKLNQSINQDDTSNATEPDSLRFRRYSIT